MTKAEFITRLAEKCDCQRQQAEKILEAVLSSLEDGLSSDSRLSFKGFGVFEVKERSARTCRNPSTGQPMEVPACKTVVFRPADALKSIVNPG